MEKKSFECPDWRTIPEDDLIQEGLVKRAKAMLKNKGGHTDIDFQAC